MMNNTAYSIFDLHCDTITCRVSLSMGKDRLAKSDGHIDLPRLKAGGALAQAFAVFAPAEPVQELLSLGETPEAVFDASYAWYERELSENAGDIAPVRIFLDFQKNREAGKVSALLTLEDGALIRQVEDVNVLYEKGVRMAALTWNFENSLGFPNTIEWDMSKGLTALGQEALHRMQQLGMVVDVSHLSDGGFADVAALSKKPFVASHSNARAICDHPRNLTDHMLRALAKMGGAAGLNFYNLFVGDTGATSIEGILRHALHIRKVAGVETLCLGSDFDGISCELEIGDYAGYPALLRALEAHFTPREMDLITHGNALRIFRDCMGG